VEESSADLGILAVVSVVQHASYRPQALSEERESELRLPAGLIETITKS
jgi:hypothetical protein